MRLQGEMQLFLDALGARADDERLQPVLDLPGDTTDTAESRGPDGHVFQLVARRGGTEFLFGAGRLVAVFVGTQPREAWGAYPRADALIDGLSGTASRAEVRARFGDPDWHTDAADRYRAGEDHLQLQYRDDRIEVMVAAIGER
jgi:hypothetical protein